MTDVVNALKDAGLVAGVQKAILDRMPTIRNYALHTNWDKISEPDVGGVIGFAEQFLLTKFSSSAADNCQLDRSCVIDLECSQWLCLVLQHQMVIGL